MDSLFNQESRMMSKLSEVSGPAYRVHTKRLLLRCFEPKDAPLFKEAVDASFDHLYPWMTWTRREPEGLESKVQRLRQLRSRFDSDRDFVYGIFDVGESVLLGAGGLHTRIGPNVREIGYWIHKNYLGRGFATEVAAALVRIGFEIDKVMRIEIHVDPRNERSARIPEKLGFIYEATLKRRGFLADGRPRDSMIWTLFADNYPGSPSASELVTAYDVLGRRIL